MSLADSYYEKPLGKHTDGSCFYTTAKDDENEDRARAVLEAKWKCELKKFGRMCPIDFYALQHDRMKALVEIKSREHEAGKFNTVFLNVRKWLALQMGSVGMGVPAFFVVDFLDAIYFINVGDVDATKVKIGGTKRIVKSSSDIEPVIEVPIADMKLLFLKPSPSEGAAGCN
jgi:hypothetical protein